VYQSINTLLLDMIRFILVIVFFSFVSCNPKDDKKIINGKDVFTWDVQLAGYDYSKSDRKGEVNYSNFINEFDNFPWMEQIDKYQEIRSGCSPTMSVTDNLTGKNFWVSMAGDSEENIYLIGYIYLKDKTRNIRWLEIYLTEYITTVKHNFKLFFNRNFEELESSIRQLELYEQMESKDLAF